MSKLASREFYLARVLDHEEAAANCGDPMMRQIWQATAAEWREVSQRRPAPPRRKAKGRSVVKWESLMAAPASAVGDAVLAFNDRDQIELIVGQSLLMGLIAAPAAHVLFEDGPVAPPLETPVQPQIQEFDLIL